MFLCSCREALHHWICDANSFFGTAWSPELFSWFFLVVGRLWYGHCDGLQGIFKPWLRIRPNGSRKMKYFRCTILPIMFTKERGLNKALIMALINIQNYFVQYSGEYDVCDVTLSVHPHRESWKVCLTTVGIEPETFGIRVQCSTELVIFRNWV